MADQKDAEDVAMEANFKKYNVPLDDDDKLLGLAKLAETSERFNDVVFFMGRLIEIKLKKGGSPLDREGRNLFSVGWKNVIGKLRTAWRIVNEEAAGEKDDKEKQATLADYAKEIAKSIKTGCEKIQSILETLAKNSENAEKAGDDFVFYKKMMGDYYRYAREAHQDEESYLKKCEEHYSAAWKAATETTEKGGLAPTNPTRLGLALNFSVCYYEILNKPDEATKLAKEAFDQAIEKLDSLNDDSYKDSTLIMQLLRDNLTIWTTKNDDGDEEAA